MSWWIYKHLSARGGMEAVNPPWSLALRDDRVDLRGHGTLGGLSPASFTG